MAKQDGRKNNGRPPKEIDFDLVRQLIEDGHSLNYTRGVVGGDIYRIKRFLKENNLQTNAQKKLLETGKKVRNVKKTVTDVLPVEKLKQLLIEGKTIEEIAEEYGYKSSSINSHVYRCGLKVSELRPRKKKESKHRYW